MSVAIYWAATNELTLTAARCILSFAYDIYMLSGAAGFGSCAAEISEPCQVGNKAALRGSFRVPRGCLGPVTRDNT